MSKITHPRLDLGGIEFGPASSKAMAVIDRETYSEWGMSLTLEQYFEREKTMRQVEWSKSGLETWWLHRPQNATSDFLSSCETFRQKTNDGKNIYVICSVFTPKKHRGNRYAGELLNRLYVHLERTDSQFKGCMLFSDIGLRFYENLGYRSIDQGHWILDLKELAPVGNNQSADEGGEWIRSSDFHGFEYPLANLDPLLPPLVPTRELLQWREARAKFYAQTLGRPYLEKNVLIDSQSPPESYIVTCIEPRLNRLNVLWSRFRNPHDKASMTKALIVKAQALKVNQIKSWSALPAPFTHEAKPDSLAMVRLHGISEIHEPWTSPPYLFWA